jgi:hypothetical protein
MKRFLLLIVVMIFSTSVINLPTYTVTVTNLENFLKYHGFMKIAEEKGIFSQFIYTNYPITVKIVAVRKKIVTIYVTNDKAEVDASALLRPFIISVAGALCETDINKLIETFRIFEELDKDIKNIPYGNLWISLIKVDGKNKTVIYVISNFDISLLDYWFLEHHHTAFKL